MIIVSYRRILLFPTITDKRVQGQEKMLDVNKHVHVNVPFRMLLEGYLELFIKNRLNPEIGFDAEVLDRSRPEDFQRVSAEIHSHGLTVTLHFPFVDLSPGSPERGVRDLTARRFEQMMPLISLFKPRAAVCHSGYDWRRYDSMRKIWLRNSMTIWPEIAGRIQAEGCSLMMENVYEESPQDILELIEGLKELGVGFCLDTGHQAVFARSPLLQWIHALSPHLRHVHLHDNLGERDDHMALGEGAIDFELCFREMKRLLPSPPLITLEPHREEDLFPSLRFLKRLWPW